MQLRNVIVLVACSVIISVWYESSRSKNIEQAPLYVSSAYSQNSNLNNIIFTYARNNAELQWVLQQMPIIVASDTQIVCAVCNELRDVQTQQHWRVDLVTVKHQKSCNIMHMISEALATFIVRSSGISMNEKQWFQIVAPGMVPSSSIELPTNESQILVSPLLEPEQPQTEGCNKLNATIPNFQNVVEALYEQQLQVFNKHKHMYSIVKKQEALMELWKDCTKNDVATLIVDPHEQLHSSVSIVTIPSAFMSNVSKYMNTSCMEHAYEVRATFAELQSRLFSFLASNSAFSWYLVPNLTTIVYKKPREHGVTLATHMSMDRMFALDAIVQRWNGPIVVVVNVQHISECNLIRMYGAHVMLKCYVNPFQDESTLNNTNILFSEQPVFTRYPVNILRNLAMDLVQTVLLLNVDGDFAPDSTLYSYLTQSLNISLVQGNVEIATKQSFLLRPITEIEMAGNLIGLLCQNTIFVIPAFQQTNHLVHIPNTMQGMQLLLCLTR